MDAPIILVVEDDETGRYVLKQLMERFDYDAHLVSSGEEALAAMKMTKYACVLLDIVLPGIDGFECARRLRQKGNKTPVIALSGRVDPIDRKTALAAGVNDFLSKPFEPEELRKILLRHVYDAKHPNLKVITPIKEKKMGEA